MYVVLVILLCVKSSFFGMIIKSELADKQIQTHTYECTNSFIVAIYNLHFTQQHAI